MPDLSAPAPDVAAPLDMLLTQGALGAGPRALPLRTGAALLRGLASRPRRVAARAGTLTAELGRIAVGASGVAPSKRDKRFADPAWTGNPALRRLVQSYLAAGQALEGLAQDVPMDWRDKERVTFAVANLVAAASPSNNPLLSPVAWKAAIDTGGLSLVRGARNMARDLGTAPRIPAMVDRSKHRVGEELAATPGVVVLRTPVYELIRYTPTTETVREVPLLVVPPTINKYYVLDLAPQRSLVEHLLSQGQQVLMMSWRNPDARHSKWGMDTYVTAVLEALDATREVCGTGTAHLLGACSGGILASVALAHLTGEGQQDTVASLTLLVTVLDQARAGTTGALIDESVAAAAVAASRRKGYLDGRRLAEVFAWLRPGDLIWNYWVNNYLEGKQPPAFDILAWNADTTRMTARLHADFIGMSLSNALVRPGGLTVLGREVDLSRVEHESYVVAGVADHLCPWESCYRSARLFSGPSRFVLSTNGHIAALVNPVGNPKSSFLASPEDGQLPEDAASWQEKAETVQGSWWSDYTRWLGERSGGEAPAPTELATGRFRVLEAAPGSYVLDA